MENNRRIKEEQKREQRAKNIAAEIYANETKNIEVIFNWQQIEKMENTEELAKEVKKQNEECKKIIDSKETLIHDLEDELVKKDEEYKDSLKKMETDIDFMIEGMRKQFYEMRRMYSLQLKQIELAFKNERKEILERNKKEIERLLAEHDEQEKKNQADRLASEEEHGKRLEDDRKANIINYMNKKMLMEQEKQSIERALEELRAVFLLNQAVLEYNVKVLEEKKDENSLIEKEINAKVKRYRERRADLRKAIKKIEDDAERENMQLTRDYERVSEQFRLLQKKFQHFQKADQKRFEEIKDMNEAEVKTLMQKIIKADKVIHMQQLGIPMPPLSEFITQYLEGAAGTMGATTMMHETSSLIEGSRAAGKSEGGEEQSVMTKNLEERVPIERVNEVFRLLARETSFLIDDKTKEAIREAPRGQRFGMQVEALCNALTIERGDIELLINTFYDHSIKPSFIESRLDAGKEEATIPASEIKKTDEAKKEPEEGKVPAKEEETKELPQKEEEKKEEGSPIDKPFDDAEGEENALQVDPDEVVPILEEFIEKRRQRMELPENAGSPSKRKKKGAAESETERIEKERKKDREHWEHLTKVLDESKLNLWNVCIFPIIS